ncbi:hypothetical protein [Polynucleobacter rarus]|uniref:hypothetical protein n=1 Tax=Polynucleobacter rarus TaxID=556055 RepID=UPI00131F101E|nr:hypothetical protein [Polynucleobacter rarus]
MNNHDNSEDYWKWIKESSNNFEDAKKSDNLEIQKLLSDKYKFINWDYWLDFIFVEDWIAVALSLGINPEFINRYPNNQASKFDYHIFGGSPSDKIQFADRLDILQNNKHSSRLSLGLSNILLKNFVEWAITKNSFKNMPPELLSLLKPKDASLSEVLASDNESKIFLRERNYSEFLNEKITHGTWDKCAESYGISRQRYNNYRKFAENRDHPKSLNTHIFSNKGKRN